jgi:hypothetical protein
MNIAALEGTPPRRLRDRQNFTSVVIVFPGEQKLKIVSVETQMSHRLRQT